MFGKKQHVGEVHSEKVPSKPIYLNTRTLTSHLAFGPYIFLPIAATLIWLGGLLALMGLWVHSGKPKYEQDEGNVVYISDVGGHYKTLFIIICACTSFFYIMSMFAERWLRHVDRLPSDVRRREQIFDWIAIFFACCGSAGLILLSIFDTFNHSTIHWSMTLVFVVCVALSAIFQSAEVWSLHKDHPDRRHLYRNSIYKLIVVTIALLVAIAFGITYGLASRDKCGDEVLAQSCVGVSDASGALEWTVAFVLVFYFATLIADLWPAGKSSPRYMRRVAQWQEKHDPHSEHNFAGREAFNDTNAWQGQNGHALAPGEMRSARPSTVQGSDAGLIRHV